jgi:hypothetical protein
MTAVLAVVLGAIIASTGSMVGAMADVNPGPTLMVDLFDLQWYQSLGLLLAGLGLSPAPWLLGLATNRIQFTGPAEKEKQRALEEQKRHYEALLASEARRYSDLEKSNEQNAAAAKTERTRADFVTDAVLEIKEVVEANTHVIASVHQVAREATGT